MRWAWLKVKMIDFMPGLACLLQPSVLSNVFIRVFRRDMENLMYLVAVACCCFAEGVVVDVQIRLRFVMTQMWFVVLVLALL